VTAAWEAVERGKIGCALARTGVRRPVDASAWAPTKDVASCDKPRVPAGRGRSGDLLMGHPAAGFGLPRSRPEPGSGTPRTEASK
jgi:hypothetical protein